MKTSASKKIPSGSKDRKLSESTGKKTTSTVGTAYITKKYSETKGKKK